MNAPLWDALLRDRAEEALAFAVALDEQAARNRMLTAIREAEQVAELWGTGHWTGRETS